MENPRILAFSGSPRQSGNGARLLERFINGASVNGVETEVVYPHRMNIKPCTGCLRCNVLKRCAVQDDNWSELSGKILAADIIVFAAPVYFHHLPGPVKTVMDRFRSFIHIQVTETGLDHTPWVEWNKHFILILSMGSSDDSDAQPVIELFQFMASILGPGNSLHVLKATRLAMSNQVMRSAEDLRVLYRKLNLPPHLAETDYLRNREILEECKKLGMRLSIK
jgi:NAD(P)H-dependent FMN reductase